MHRILLLFYQNKSAQLHLRDIARQSQLNEHSASRFLKRLEAHHILESRTTGNLRIFSLCRHDSAFAMMLQMDVEKHQSLPVLRKTAMRMFLDNLPGQPVYAIAFGSTAKGTYKAQSDIDMLIVVNKSMDLTKAISKVDALTTLRMHCVQIEYSDFLTEIKLKEDKVISSAIATGYPLINHIEYYRKVLDESLRPLAAYP